MIENQERAIDLAQKLMAKAEGTDNPHERDAFLKKATEIMDLHRLDMLVVKEHGKAKMASEPIAGQTVPLFTADWAHVSEGMLNLASAVASHCQVQFLMMGFKIMKTHGLKLKVYGFKSDLEWFETLLTSLRLQVMKEIDPKWDDNLTLGANVYRMKEAGLPWKTIAMRCDPDKYPDEDSWDPKDGSWIRIYHKMCDIEGTRPKGANPRNFQHNFMLDYALIVGRRLDEMRHNAAQGLANDNLPVLRSHREKIAEEIVKDNPQIKTVKTAKNAKYNRSAAEAGRAAGERADLTGRKTEVGRGGPRELGA